MKKLFSPITIIMLAAMLSASASQDIRGHWRLDDGTGFVIADASGNGNIGFAKDIQWKAGVRNSCILFDGKGVINCGNDSSLCPENGLTIEAWMKPWQLPYNNYPTIMHKEGSYAFRFAPGGKLSLLLWLDGKEQELTSKNTEWPNSKWQHVAATFDGSKITLYVNGEKDNELAVKGKIAGSKTYCYIGSVNGKSVMTGHLDEIRITGRAFTADEIFASYDDGLFELERVNDHFSAYFSKKRSAHRKPLFPDISGSMRKILMTMAAGGWRRNLCLKWVHPICSRQEWAILWRTHQRLSILRMPEHIDYGYARKTGSRAIHRAPLK